MEFNTKEDLEKLNIYFKERYEQNILPEEYYKIWESQYNISKKLISEGKKFSVSLSDFTEDFTKFFNEK
jgi:beta-lactamase class D